jgi:hypothetical protein
MFTMRCSAVYRPPCQTKATKEILNHGSAGRGRAATKDEFATKEIKDRKEETS